MVEFYVCICLYLHCTDRWMHCMRFWVPYCFWMLHYNVLVCEYHSLCHCKAPFYGNKSSLLNPVKIIVSLFNILIWNQNKDVYTHCINGAASQVKNMCACVWFDELKFWINTNGWMEWILSSKQMREMKRNWLGKRRNRMGSSFYEWFQI